MKLIDQIIEASRQFDFCFTVSKTGSDRNLIYVNNHFQKVTGFSKEECVGKNCSFLQGDQTDYSRVLKLRYALNKTQSTFQDLVNYRKDGSLFVNRLIILPLSIMDHSENYFLGFQNELPIDNINSANLIGLENIALNEADLNHYIKNPLNTAVQFLNKGEIDRGMNAVSRIREFILGLDQEQKFPKVY